MPPRDVPDVSVIMHTKRDRRRPRPADEERSLAPNAGSTNAEHGRHSSASQEPVGRSLPSSPIPGINPPTPFAGVIQEPAVNGTEIPGLGTMERGGLSPTASIASLVSETPATPEMYHRQETTQGGQSMNPREEGAAGNEQGKFAMNSIASPGCLTL